MPKNASLACFFSRCSVQVVQLVECEVGLGQSDKRWGGRGWVVMGKEANVGGGEVNEIVLQFEKVQI